MKVSKDFLLAEAESTGFRPEILEKVLHLINVLNGLTAHPFLKGRLALKGGTALNLFVFDLPRLSVDIDLNYIGSPDREVMLSERPKLEKALKDVCGREGLSLRRMNDDHAAMTFFFRYESALGQGGDLKVDLNFMFRIPLWFPITMDSHPIGPYRATGFPVLDIHELAGGKLAALMVRQAGRDLFDVHQLLTGAELDVKLLRFAFVVYGATNRKDWRTVRVSDVSFTEDGLRKDLLPLLRSGELTDSDSTMGWGERLVEETRKSLSSLLPFSEAEKEFLDRLLDQGEVNHSLLTEDEYLSERIAQHPGLGWKAVNVRQFKRSGSKGRSTDGGNTNDELP